MRYLLVVITHGEAPALDRVLNAFRANVYTEPAERVLFIDGADGNIPNLGNEWWDISASQFSRGFCETTRSAWAYAATCNVDYVFWLENDFVITRPIDLEPLAFQLEADHRLAQMQLMRNAVNDAEKDAGGLFESRRDQYVSHGAWLEHVAYMTTNPSLMRRQFMAENHWPEYSEECEGRFGIDLVRAGYKFGVWGEGDPWCEHVGVRSGFGY